MLKDCRMDVTKHEPLSCSEEQFVLHRLQQTACKVVLDEQAASTSLQAVPQPTCENVGRSA